MRPEHAANNPANAKNYRSQGDGIYSEASIRGTLALAVDKAL